MASSTSTSSLGYEVFTYEGSVLRVLLRKRGMGVMKLWSGRRGGSRRTSTAKARDSMGMGMAIGMRRSSIEYSTRFAWINGMGMVPLASTMVGSLRILLLPRNNRQNIKS